MIANTKKPTSLTHLRLLGRVVPVSSVTNLRIGDNDGGGGHGGGGHGGPNPGHDGQQRENQSPV